MERRLHSHTEAEQVLRRAGYHQDHIEALLRDVPDPIDCDRDAGAFFKHGISVDVLADRMGASP